MRIQVVFNNTPILVPCGDGKLTVGELIQKAIVRFKKLGNKVRGDWCPAVCLREMVLLGDGVAALLRQSFSIMAEQFCGVAFVAAA